MTIEIDTAPDGSIKPKLPIIERPEKIPGSGPENTIRRSKYGIDGTNENEQIDYKDYYVDYASGYIVPTIFYGYGGKDGIYGSQLNDQMWGGEDNDYLSGWIGDDKLYGEGGNDYLGGGPGKDEMWGGLGDDEYFVDNDGDDVTESIVGGVDTVTSAIRDYILADNVEGLVLLGESAALNGTGNALDNRIAGNEFDNMLDGGLGNDILGGGYGNDVYFVNSSGDVVIEESSSGGSRDKVYTSISYTLSDNVEQLDLQNGTSASYGKGNSLNNIIFGNELDNNLDGSTGDDVLSGFGGNDAYVVDSIGDVVIEDDSTDGSDIVETYVNYTLAANVEGLYLMGTSAINGTGNALSNLIQGNDAQNTLDGGAGTDALWGASGYDVLTGGTGTDIFFFLDRTEGIDYVTDFSVTDDTIKVSAEGFGGGLTVGAAITSDQFTFGTAATLPSHRFIYDNTSGDLLFDLDGSVGPATPVHFVTLSTDLAMTNNNIFVLA